MSGPRETPNCFGFFGGPSHLACQNCTAINRCKAILISNGFDIIGDLVSHMAFSLPENVEYRNTNQISEIVKQLRNPPSPIDDKTAELLKLAEAQKSVPPDIQL